jgi:hypothetical protein
MDLNNDMVNDKVSQVVQDINDEINSQYVQNIETEIDKLRNQIDKRFNKVSDIESKIEKCNVILDYLDEKNDHPDCRIVVESWKQFLEKKKSKVHPDELIEKKGQLNNTLRKIKAIYKMCQAV